MTKHKYQFSCRHTALATNEFVLGTSITTNNYGNKRTERFCPSCHDRIQAALARCMESGRKYQNKRALQSLPPLGGE